MAKFLVRARAVDMLGRQQIAGIPTAIHELFKNAHDAYAGHIEVDYFRADELLVIRDDGFGMTRSEFETRWLTLGTESKVGKNRSSLAWAVPPGGRARPIMGEKGIGRLAIAAIGPQVLVMSRASRPEGLQPLVASLIHWGLFEVPGIDLSAIEIPILEIPDGKLPDKMAVKSLADGVRRNIEAIGSLISPDDRERFLSQLKLIEIDPDKLARRMEGPSLAGEGHGTHFLVRPSYTILADDIEAADDENASPLEKMLLGFSNTMATDPDPDRIVAEFRDWRQDGTCNELIGPNSFFTPRRIWFGGSPFSGHVRRVGPLRRRCVHLPAPAAKAFGPLAEGIRQAHRVRAFLDRIRLLAGQTCGYTAGARRMG